MYVHDDLLLIRDQLSRLTETAYFERALAAHARDVIAFIEHVVGRIGAISPEIALEVRREVWTAYQHLGGSTSKELPYEIVHALSRALRSWSSRPNLLITTALVDEPNFYFARGLRWERVATLFPEFQTPDPARTLVQISLPRLYRRRPLNCIPLYHELAHHIDDEHKIAEATILASGVKAEKGGEMLQRNYFREHFADLFSACYCGSATLRSVERIAGLRGPTRTHPPANLRTQIVLDFVEGRANQIVDDFNKVLRQRDLPELSLRFTPLDLGATFDDIRPWPLQSEEELHGIFPSGWDYLERAFEGKAPPWAGMQREDVARTVNDLVEKSIRNMDIREKWANAAVG